MNSELKRMLAIMAYDMMHGLSDAKFKIGDRVFVTTDSDAGGEQPEGTVVFPGSMTTIRLDPEFRWPEEDTGIREIREDCLALVLQGE